MFKVYAITEILTTKPELDVTVHAVTDNSLIAHLAHAQLKKTFQDQTFIIVPGEFSTEELYTIQDSGIEGADMLFSELCKHDAIFEECSFCEEELLQEAYAG